MAGMKCGKTIPMEAIVEVEHSEVQPTMNYRILESQGRRYLHFTNSDSLIQREQDAVDIITLCAEHNTSVAILDGDVLSDDFVQLRTGLAGAVLQKLANYNIRAAVVIRGRQNFPVRFQEMVYEYGTGSNFRIFSELEDAVSWLLRQGQDGC